MMCTCCGKESAVIQVFHIPEDGEDSSIWGRKGMTWDGMAYVGFLCGDCRDKAVFE